MRTARAVSLAALVALAGLSCSTVDGSDEFTITAPSRAAFVPVGDFLIQRCGSLDCHGQVGRNLRLYGIDGLRLAAPDTPGLQKTTTSEYDADFASIVWLEPEVMSAVVQQEGAHPERLTMIAKPLGLEEHKGGTLMQAGDAQDTCITSWLAGAVDLTACANAMKTR
jgi:hypothetical protein